MFIPLLVLFAALEIADNALTLYGIKHLGFREKNKIMRPIVAKPWLSWIVSAVVIGLIGFLCFFVYSQYPWLGIGTLAFACILKAKPVIHNLRLHKKAANDN